MPENVMSSGNPNDTRPDPDPTRLTKIAVEEGNRWLRELIEARLDAMDKATDLLQRATDNMPGYIRSEVSSLQELHGERFKSIAVQFAERDTRTEQTSRDSKVAVDAALQAAKEAVGEQNKSNSLAIAKSETSTTKQLDQIQISFSGMSKGFDDKINDVKERVNGVDARVAAVDARAAIGNSAVVNRDGGRHETWAYVMSGLALLFAAITAIIAAMRHV